MQAVMTSTRRRLRTSWAAKALLLLGLFGFIVGWANACVQHQPPPHAGGYEQAAQRPAPPGHAQHGPGDADPHECDAMLDGCESLCDLAQSLVPKTEPPRALDGTAWPAAIPTVAAAWASDRVAPEARPETRTALPSVSVVLRFLRLTL
jgi:hypothetical protein